MESFRRTVTMEGQKVGKGHPHGAGVRNISQPLKDSPLQVSLNVWNTQKKGFEVLF